MTKPTREDAHAFRIEEEPLAGRKLEVRRLLDRLLRVPSVMSAHFTDNFEPVVLVVFELDAEGRKIGFEAVAAIVEDHVRERDAVAIYVGDVESGRRLLHADRDFVLLDDSEDTDAAFRIGVSMHFLDDGARQTKWFVDEAAVQLRQLAARRDRTALHYVVGKHIELDAAPAPRSR